MGTSSGGGAGTAGAGGASTAGGAASTGGSAGSGGNAGTGRDRAGLRLRSERREHERRLCGSGARRAIRAALEPEAAEPVREDRRDHRRQEERVALSSPGDPRAGQEVHLRTEAGARRGERQRDQQQGDGARRSRGKGDRFRCRYRLALERNGALSGDHQRRRQGRRRRISLGESRILEQGVAVIYYNHYDLGQEGQAEASRGKPNPESSTTSTAASTRRAS